MPWNMAIIDRGARAPEAQGQVSAAEDALFTPPTLPASWAKHDAALAKHLVLHQRRGGAAFGGESCACGGRWRYTLAGSDAHPIWRCLHCGGLFRGSHRLA